MANAMSENMQMIRWYDNWMKDKYVRMKQWDETVRKKIKLNYF